MKRQIFTHLFLGAILGVLVFLAYCAGHYFGTNRPRIFRTAFGQEQIAFGWDKGNNCVAMWTSATNYFYWTRLE